MSAKDSAKAIVNLFGFKGKFDLCLDRTNWKFGNKNINYLVLSWRINKQLSLPLFFVELDKAGNSNTKERLDLLEDFNEVFGFHRIKSLTADREFVGNKWYEVLDQQKIPYFIRIKENTLLPWGKDSPIQAKRLFHHLTQGQERLVEKKMYGGTVYFAGTVCKDGDLLIVMTNQKKNARQILNQYRKRWSIEELFRKLKSSGFHWENTHMKDPPRLITLLIILSFALLIAYLMGRNIKTPWKKTLDYPLYSVFKQGLIHFQYLVAQSSFLAVQTICNLLKNARYLIFSKTDG